LAHWNCTVLTLDDWKYIL